MAEFFGDVIPGRKFTLADEAGVFSFDHWYRNSDGSMSIVAHDNNGAWRAFAPSRVKRWLPKETP